MSQTAATAIADGETPARKERPWLHEPRMLIRVASWELRRFGASRTFWLEALGFFGLLFVIAWSTQAAESLEFGPPGGPTAGVALRGFVAGTSARGLLDTLPNMLVLLVLLLPFVTADGVTRDLQRRTHELLMTTILPTKSYIWGRYLSGLLIAVGLSVLMLVAVAATGEFLYLTVADYPAPAIGALVLLWAGMVLPATVLVSSAGFALATLLPSFTTPIKVVILLGWVVGALFIPNGMRDTVPPAWYVNWDPTSVITARGVLAQYSMQDVVQTATSQAEFQRLFVAMENKMPVIGSWLAAHLVMTGLSLLLALAVPLGFKRSRDVLS